MHYIFLIFFPLFLNAESSFITKEEYAIQFYHSPRGIGCHHCHGENGEGRVVARYKNKNSIESFSGPAINTLSYEEFYKAMTSRKRGMPRYFLIDDEIETLYFYLHRGENNDSN